MEERRKLPIDFALRARFIVFLLRKDVSVPVRLLIGEIAELLGTSTKTIRHYEKIGLLDEAERTFSGYRLYDAQDLLRLYRIKQLQDLGLSLERIRIFLQGPEQAQPAEDVLRSLEAEITAQIAELEERRKRVRELLSQEPVDILNQQQEAPPSVRLLQEYLGEQVGLDAAKANYGDTLGAQLDVFLWRHAEYQQQQRELIQELAEQPEARNQIAELMGRIALLDKGEMSAEEVDELAGEIVRLRIENPILSKMMLFCDQLEWPHAEMLGQILTGSMDLTPRQRKLFEVVGKRITT